MLANRYEEALPILRAEAQRDKQDDFLIGPVCHVGVALLLAGDIEGARLHFSGLLAQAKSQCSLHYIYLGIVCWAGRDLRGSVLAWTESMNCGYTSRLGLDGPLLLYFAAVREPGSYSKQSALKLIEQRLGQLQGSGFDRSIGQFIVGQISRDELLLRASNNQGRFAKQINALHKVDSSFYVAIDCLLLKDAGGYLDNLSYCASAVGCKQFSYEVILARKELELSTK